MPKAIFWGILFLLPSFALAQICDSDDCDQLVIAELRGQFTLWPSAGSDCNADGKVNTLDFTCMINQVPDLGAPVFQQLSQQAVETGQTLSFLVEASDPNDDPLTFSAINLPENASFDPKTLVFSFTPLSHQIGVVTIRFVANDGFLQTFLDVVIAVSGSQDCTAEPTNFQASPAHGELEVAVTRETILRFSRPLLDSGTYDQTVIYSEFAGSILPARYRLSADRKTVTLFYSEPLPASARIRLTVLGDRLMDERGCFVDADGDGLPGGSALVDFDTLTLSVVASTSVCGRVFNSNLVPSFGSNNLVNQPLEGVTITVDGMEETLFTVTDSLGNFRLEPAPAGRFFVHIDGRTATQGLPPGSYYPYVGKTWTAVTGQEVTIGEVYLPLVIDGTLQQVSNTEETQIGFPSEVIAQDARFADVKITVPAGSLFDNQGNFGGMVGLAPVDPQRLPGVLPEDLNFALVITVQTDGATNFDTPAPICFPNLPDPDSGELLRPGAKSALWSFNHDSGNWEISGSMTVNQDGTLVCSDPGVGIRAPGWHGVRPGTQGGGAQPGDEESPEEAPPKPDCDDFAKNPTDPIHLFSGEFHNDYQDLRIKGRGFDFIWSRSYRSRIGPNTVQGNGWDFAYNIFLEQDGLMRRLCNGKGRADSYLPRPDMPNTWSRNEFFQELKLETDGSYTLTQSDGSRWTFLPLNGAQDQGKISAMIDRNGNTMRFSYDGQGRLNRIIDTLGRQIDLTYNAAGFIESVSDFSSRSVTYAYYGPNDPLGGIGDLKSVTTPAVTGTPNGNDFPSGKTTLYTYSVGKSQERLNHNLLTETDPKGQTFLVNTYAETNDPNDPNFDRVLSQQWGDPGDLIHLIYLTVTPSPQNGNALRRTIVNDRMGNVREYFYDLGNRLVRFREFTGRANPDQPTTATSNRPVGKLRATDPDYFETRYEWNADSLPSRQIFPNGNITEFIYESDLDPRASPRKRGNLRTIRHLPGTHQPAGDQPVREEHFEYDDDFGCGSCGSNFITRHVDARGNETLHDYDNRGNRLSTTHRISSIVEQWQYNAYGQLSAQILPDNGSGSQRHDELHYYSEGAQAGYLEKMVVDTANLALTTRFAYDAVGNLISQTDPRGHDQQFVVNALDQVVRAISRELSPGSGIRYQTDYFYDANDNLIQTDVLNLDESGNLHLNSVITTRFEYETLNNLIRRTNEVDTDHNVVLTYAYDANRNRILERDGEATNGNQPGNSTRLYYDERDLLYQQVKAEGEPEQSSTQINYDGNKNPVQRRVGLENNTRDWDTVFDGYNRTLLVVDPMGNETESSYDANGNLVRQQVHGELLDLPGKLGNQLLSDSSFSYDPMDRMIIRQDAFFNTASGTPIDDGKATTTWIWNDISQLASEADDNGNRSSYSYDTANRLDLATDAAGNSVSYDYDANNNLISQTESGLSDLGAPVQHFTTRFAYDPLDRQIRITDNIGNQHQLAYDSRDNLTRQIDALGNLSVYNYDGLNRLTATHLVLTDTGTGAGTITGTIVTRQYWDDSSRLVGLSDGLGNLTSYQYDALNRATTITFADGTRTSTTYDVHDNALTQTDAAGNFLTNSHDLLNRLIHRTITPGPGVDPGTSFESFAFDGISRLVQARDDDSSVAFSYDSLSHQTAETLNGKTTTTSFDGEGNQTSCTYPGGRLIHFSYDSLNRIHQIREGANTLANYSYVGARVEQLDLGNLTRMELTYDGISGIANPSGDAGVQRLIKTRHSYVPGAIVLDEHHYRWDARYNKTSRINQLSGFVQDFGYDSAYRMRAYQETTVGSGAQSTEFSLDAANNRTQVTGGTEPGTYLLSASLPEPADAQMNQYTSTSFDQRSYDQNGNLAAIDLGLTSERVLTYDYRNQLTSYTDGSTSASYGYDALGRRFTRTVNNASAQTTLYFYSGYQVVEEQDSTGNTQATYVYGLYVDEVLTMRRLGVDYYYHRDDLFNITALSDASGDLVERYLYGAYGQNVIIGATGNPLASSIAGNPYLFTGRHWDNESGLFYYRTRYMDPHAGRFITRDTIGIWGDLANLGNGSTYVGNNPWTQLDPFGDFVWVTSLFGAVAGGILSAIVAQKRGDDPASIGRAAVIGAVAGGVAGLTLGFGGMAIAGLTESAFLGGILSSVVSSAAGNLAGQAVAIGVGWKDCFDSQDFKNSITISLITGSFLFRPSTGQSQLVTSWASKLIKPDLLPGRWVHVGGPTIDNFLRTIGPVTKGFPFKNSVSGTLPGQFLSYPDGYTGNLTGLMGHRIIVPPK